MSIDLKKNSTEESENVIQESFFTLSLCDWLKQYEQYCYQYQFYEGMLHLSFILTDKKIKNFLFHKRMIREVTIHIYDKNPRFPDHKDIQPLTSLEHHLKFKYLNLNSKTSYPFTCTLVYDILE